MKMSAGFYKRLLTGTFFLMLFGCKKGMVENQADPLLSTGKQGSALTTLTTPDVYVAGSEGGQAKYWKNGVGVTLTGGTTANGVVVVGTDVYVCGYGYDPSTFNLVALYWKNGVLTSLSNGTENYLAIGIAVSGTDVYVAGRKGIFTNAAVYWKNGVEISLGSGEANGVFAAANGDIYIVNGESGNTSYWKNGTLVTLPGYSNAYARSIAVNGSDVFVVGARSGSTETALFWKNGVLQPISTQFNTNAMAVAVNSSGQAVFSGITGQNLNNMHIAYWDALHDLNILASGQQVAPNTGIAVDQNTDAIYVCGSEFNSQSTPPARAKYWVISNTGGVTPITLSNGSADATALAIALGY